MCTRFTFVSSGKTWGDPCGQLVLCVHGIQDNAGSFDRLVPLLPSAFCYVCIDLPGHGCSSHFPEGLPLDFMDYVLALIRVLNHLRQDSCYYIGHSLGGQLGLYLCGLWPQRIKKLVLLDTIGPMHTETEIFLPLNKLLLDNVLSTEERFSSKESPNYTYKEALDRLMTNRASKLTEEAARALIKRSLTRNSAGGSRFTTDQRLKMGLWVQLNEKQQLQVCTCVTNLILNYIKETTLEGLTIFSGGLLCVHFSVLNHSIILESHEYKSWLICILHPCNT